MSDTTDNDVSRETTSSTPSTGGDQGGVVMHDPDAQRAPQQAERPAPVRAPMILDHQQGPIMPFMPQTTDDLGRLVNMIIQGGVVPKGFETDGLPDKSKMAVAILAGREVGFGPMMSLKSIMVVNGMTTVWGAGAKALVLRSGQVTDYRKEWIDVDSIEKLPRPSHGTDSYGDAVLAIKAKREAGFVILYNDNDETVIAKKLNLPASSVPTVEWPSVLGCFIAVGRKGVATPYTGMFSVGDARRAKLWDNFKKLYHIYPQDMLEHRAAARAYDRGFSDCLMGLAIRELVDDQEIAPSKTVDGGFLQAN